MRDRSHSGKTDVLTPRQRSYNMSRIRGQDTRPERILRKALWQAGLRYRLKSALPGKPDLTFPSARVALFVDGCFWHACPMHVSFPKGNAEFWRLKLANNVERDRRVERELDEMGWRVIRIWEHDLGKAGSKALRNVVWCGPLQGGTASHQGRRLRRHTSCTHVRRGWLGSRHQTAPSTCCSRS